MWGHMTLASSLDPIDVTAAATVALALVAAVQIGREVYRGWQRRAGVRRRLTGAAWLARRTCEVTLRAAPGISNSIAMAFYFTKPPALDRLQRHFREVLALSSAIGGAAARHGEKAFEGFLAAADRCNEVARPSMPTPMHEYPQMVEEGLLFLYDAVVELEQLAPRHPHEPRLPARAAMRQVRPPAPPAPQVPPSEPQSDPSST